MIPLLAAALAGSTLDDHLPTVVKRGDVPNVQRLLAEGADPDGYGSLRQRPLWLAVEGALKSDTGMVEVLLAAGADPDVSPRGGQTVLRYVMTRLHLPRGPLVARQLLGAGARPVDRGESLLAWYQGGHPEHVVDLAMEIGVGLDQLVCDAPDVDVLAGLLQRGADPAASCDGTPPLLRAVIAQDVARVELLLEAGVDPAQPGMWKRSPVTALHVSAARDWERGMDLFLTDAVDPNARVGAMGAAPLDRAVGDAVRRLVTAGATRSKPSADVEVWTAHPLGPAEVLPYLQAVVAHEAVPLLPPWDEALGEGGRAWLSDRIEHLSAAPTAVGLTPDDLRRARAFLLDPSCPIDARTPTLSTVKDAFGRPTERAREGVVRTWTFADGVVARGWHRGLRNRVVELHDACGDGAGSLVGVHRAAVWMALDERPELVQPDRDRWTLPGPVLEYVDHRLVRAGTAFW